MPVYQARISLVIIINHTNLFIYRMKKELTIRILLFHILIHVSPSEGGGFARRFGLLFSATYITSAAISHLRFQMRSILFFIKPIRRTAFHTVHQLAHPGRNGTTKLASQRFIWPGIKEDCSEWTKTCMLC